jgi:hypothetical protein
MAARDWLVAIDDMLTQRLTCCTACGSQGHPGMLRLLEAGDFSVAVLVCRPCERRDPESTQLLHLLEKRAGPRPARG